MMNKLYNLKKLNEIAQGDNDFVQDMLITFVENATEEIESIKKLKTLESWTAIAEIAHKLASNFAYLEADSLHALAVNIEKSVILDQNVSSVLEKTEQLCSEGTLLINELKKDFGI